MYKRQFYTVSLELPGLTVSGERMSDRASAPVSYTHLDVYKRQGNNGLIKTKYLTFGIDADSIKAAKPRLERIETDILNNLSLIHIWKSHKEDTVDWNDQKYAEIWRQGWADTANRYLEAIGSPERLDLRSYARQGIDKIPTVHMGPAVSQLEKKGIQTNIGNLNRDIKAANSLMQSIRQLSLIHI